MLLISDEQQRQQIILHKYLRQIQKAKVIIKPHSMMYIIDNINVAYFCFFLP